MDNDHYEDHYDQVQSRNMLLNNKALLTSGFRFNDDNDDSVNRQDNKKLQHQSEEASAQLIRFISDKDALIVENVNNGNKDEDENEDNGRVREETSEAEEKVMNLAKRNSLLEVSTHRKATFHRKGAGQSLKDQVHLLTKQLNTLMMHHQKDYKMLEQSLLDSLSKKIKLKNDESPTSDHQDNPNPVKDNSNNGNDYDNLRQELQQLR